MSPLSLADLDDVTHTRIELECLALRRSIARGDDAWRSALETAWEDLDTAPHLVPGEDRHHETVVADACAVSMRRWSSACGLDWLLRFRRTLFEQSERYRRLRTCGLPHARDRGRDTRGEHLRIFEATMRGDAEVAAAELASHFERTARTIVDAYRDQGQTDVLSSRAKLVAGSEGGCRMDAPLFGWMMGAVGEDGASDATLYRNMMSDADLGYALGYDAPWVVEHHFSNYYPTPSPLVMLSHIAARYPDFGLGTAVIVTPWHHPLRIAEEIAMLTLLSEGPLRIGLGRGMAPLEYETFGVSLVRGEGPLRGDSRDRPPRADGQALHLPRQALQDRARDEFCAPPRAWTTSSSSAPSASRRARRRSPISACSR